MCGRFTLRTSPQQVAIQFDLAEVPEFSPRYNIAPTQQILAVQLKDGVRHPAFLHWGLIPSWAKDTKIGNSLINARADGVSDKPAFRSAFKRGRCLVVADGFYEWRKDGKAKQPYFIRMKDDRPFAFAGLCEHWSKGETPIDSASLITTEPNPLMATIHDRMPVILPKESWDLWLDQEFTSKEKLLDLLKPYPADEMVATPVSTTVNSPRNETPACIVPVA
jgi:putative SOS response-associated peptidase YedK